MSSKNWAAALRVLVDAWGRCLSPSGKLLGDHVHCRGLVQQVLSLILGVECLRVLVGLRKCVLMLSNPRLAMRGVRRPQRPARVYLPYQHHFHDDPGTRLSSQLAHLDLFPSEQILHVLSCFQSFLERLPHLGHHVTVAGHCRFVVQHAGDHRADGQDRLG